MMDTIAYYAKTLAETLPAIVGIRGTFEQPAYTVRSDLGAQLEIRDYGPSVSAEATVAAPTQREASETAFRLLFSYITGANQGQQKIAMTAPVQQDATLIAMTTPVRVDSAPGQTRIGMRFALPASLAAHPPTPTDSRVSLVTEPAKTVAALRYTGNPTEIARNEHEHTLMRRLTSSGWLPTGKPYALNYDPPFAVPFLKRNEVVVEVSPR
jgi:hypothetical protein